MLSPQITRVLITGSLLLHGFAHGIALVALLIQTLGIVTKSPVIVRSWLLPSLSEKMAAILAMPFWITSTLCFIVGSVSFWGILGKELAWRQLAIGGSVISVFGIVVFSGIWPGSPSNRRSALNTLVAVAMNAVILVSLLWLRWPPEVLFGK